METQKKPLFRVILKDMTAKTKKDKEAAKRAGRRISATFTTYEKNGKNLSFDEFVEVIKKKVSEI